MYVCVCNFEVSVSLVSGAVAESCRERSGYFKDSDVWPLIWYVDLCLCGIVCGLVVKQDVTNLLQVLTSKSLADH